MPEAPVTPGWELERSLWLKGCRTVIGVDEAGRGCLAGPVFAAAVVLPGNARGCYRDSKQLSPEQREELALQLKREALAAAVGQASAREIDRLGILAATHLAAERALQLLPFDLRGTGLVTDYLRLQHPGPVLAVPRADARSLQTAAASILAKPSRDRFLAELDRRWPGYGFARHKGYGTRQHLLALDELGVCPEHRRSFAPVRHRLKVTASGVQCSRDKRDQLRPEAAGQY